MRRLLLLAAALACVAATHDPILDLQGWELDARSLDVASTEFVGGPRRIDCVYGEHCLNGGPLFTTVYDCAAAASNLRTEHPIAHPVGPLWLTTVYYCRHRY